MQAYRGYYIGEGPNDFHSRKEIDEFLRQRAVKRLRLLVGFFLRDGSMEASAFLSDHETQMVRQHGFTPQEVEDLEIEMMMEAKQ